MANFGKLVLTNEGLRLQALAEGGTKLKATRMAMGSGTTESTDFSELTALINEVVSVSISNYKLYNSTSFLFRGYFDNKTLQTGFTWTELGLFMEDPNDSSKEILYCYSNSGSSDADYIPASSDERYEKLLNIQVIFANAENINIEVPESVVFLDVVEFDKHVNSNMHFHVCESIGTGDALEVSIPNLTELEVGTSLLIKLHEDIELGVTLSLNGWDALPIRTADGQGISIGSVAGQYILVTYNSESWNAIGSSTSSSDSAQMVRNKETFIATSGQTVFKLKDGIYTINNKCIDLYINGIAQPKEAFEETTESSITLKSGLEAGDIVMIDYMYVGSVAYAETPNGAQKKVDTLEGKITDNFKSMYGNCGVIKTFLLPVTSWIDNEQTISYEGITDYSCLKMQYTPVGDNIKNCENANVKMKSSSESSIVIACDTVPTIDVIVDVIYQGETDVYYTWDGSAYIAHEKG